MNILMGKGLDILEFNGDYYILVNDLLAEFGLMSEFGDEVMTRSRSRYHYNNRKYCVYIGTDLYVSAERAKTSIRYSKKEDKDTREEAINDINKIIKNYERNA